MPLRDHFHPPLSVERSWQGIHGAWAAGIAGRLNQDLLPPVYFALPLVSAGNDKHEMTTATVVNSPARPTRSAPIDFLSLPAYEVQVIEQTGSRKLRAAIEIVSPTDKDRPACRLAFATKVAAYLQASVTIVLIDVVTDRTANLHEDVRLVLKLSDGFAWQSATKLYTAAYHSVNSEGGESLEAWLEQLQIGSELPDVPLWLAADLCMPLPLEETYEATCASLRITV
ncbi:MAG: DUF4058 domain-containing protein [Gemmataceae bacterium]|nr:DUF4058 domain-containing protein [Gemmataceae bacterium]